MDKTAGPSWGKPAYFGRDLEAMSFAGNYHNWILDEFRPYLGAVCAEVGAGTGNFSRLLLETGIRSLLAFEPSANMYPLLAERMRGRPQVKTFNGFFEDGCLEYEGGIDSAVYVNVLEHIERDQAELFHVRRALRVGGHVLLFVPALPFLYSPLDQDLGHIRRYHRSGLKSLVETAGFQILKLKYFDFLGILPWYLAFTLLKKPMSAGKVSLYDKAVVPMARRLEGMMQPPLGKNLLLIARKT